MHWITHLIVFVAGAAVGIYWGVQHPNQAADVANREQVQMTRLRQAVAQAKHDVLQTVVNDQTAAPDAGAPTPGARTSTPTAPPARTAKYRQMLNEADKELHDASIPGTGN